MIFHRENRENIDLPEDQGCLRWVLGVPLALVYLPAVYLFTILLAAPVDPGDDRRREDAEALGYAVVGITAVGLLLSLLPVYRRTMGRWWYVLPALMAAVAYVRGRML
ncbi:hypothetical protein [Streptomyces sp. NBC_00454]|uniref:hypothetical protein n=1 Tax=Streptomyces sp. NBC_00454 TaxID=2975747 RepID=UPI0032541EFA